MLGLHRGAGLSLVAAEGGCPPAVVHGRLTGRLLSSERRLPGGRAAGAVAHGLRAPWEVGPPGPGVGSVSPALAGRLLTTAPPGKPDPLPLAEEQLF